jgi:hypothetical protein
MYSLIKFGHKIFMIILMTFLKNLKFKQIEAVLAPIKKPKTTIILNNQIHGVFMSDL